MDALLRRISEPTPAKSVVTTILRDSPTQPLTCHDRCDCSALVGDRVEVESSPTRITQGAPLFSAT